MVGFAVVVYFEFILLPPPQFSPAQIDDFSQGIVVDIASTIPKRYVIGSGFWADSKGYMLTSSSVRTDRMMVEMMMPPAVTGSLFTLAAGFTDVLGTSVYYDPETTVDVVRVYNNPFIRRKHMGALAEDTKTGRKETITEQYAVPCLFAAVPSVGESVFLAGAEESAEGGYPTRTLIEGNVTKISADTRIRDRFLRIYTNLPFKESYRGAPVLNRSRHVIGMVLDTPGSDNAVLIPASYLQYVMNKAKPLLTDIEPSPWLR